jgi:hypothetical protein
METQPRFNTSCLGWIKAKASVGTKACVQLARAGEMIAVRDSKNPDTPPLMYTRAEIIAFLDGAKKGEFDVLVHTDDSGENSRSHPAD